MTTHYKNSIFWFRRDLRLRDNPGLHYCLENSANTLLLYVMDENCSSSSDGAASRWWLHQSLTALRKDIEKLGSSLVILKSNNISKTILDISKKLEAELVCWNRLYEPETIKRDSAIKESLLKNKIHVESKNAYLLCEPWDIKTSTGGPYQVFTPFWRKLSQTYKSGTPIPIPRKLPPMLLDIKSVPLDELGLLPKIPWDRGFFSLWNPGEEGAQKKVSYFIKNKIDTYSIDRDFPEKHGSSHLSPHLHFGEISPHDIWHQCEKHKVKYKVAEPFLRQLGWREFGAHLLYYFPDTVTEPLRSEFKTFPWSKNKRLLQAWQRGQTGYPIIDAGMRELWNTGIMHNRVRMIVGSFLVKNLLIHWHEGAKWFRDCLLDADLANNTMGWQWVAGSGADASPYFRIFNPVSQSEKFDAEGIYIRKWVPELSELSNRWIHKPFEAPKNILEASGITLGERYPKPIVDLKETREAALQAYYDLKK